MFANTSDTYLDILLPENRMYGFAISQALDAVLPDRDCSGIHNQPQATSYEEGGRCFICCVNQKMRGACFWVALSSTMTSALIMLFRLLSYSTSREAKFLRGVGYGNDSV